MHTWLNAIEYVAMLYLAIKPVSHVPHGDHIRLYYGVIAVPWYF